MSYRVRVSSNGVEVEVEGDKEFVEAKLSDLSWLEAMLEKLSTTGRGGGKAEERPSFIEFADRINPKSHPQRFLTIAYYLYKWEGRNVGYDDFEEYYQKARWPTPSNPRDVVGDLIRDRLFEDAGRVNGKRVFRILQKGIRFVENGFREA